MTAMLLALFALVSFQGAPEPLKLAELGLTIAPPPLEGLKLDTKVRG